MAPDIDVDAPTVVVPSRLFGPLTVSESAIIQFADGLKGFASQHRFVLLPTDTEGLFWLQSADEGNLAFLVIDPFVFIADYEIPMPPDGIGPFAASEYDDLVALTIVTLPEQAYLHATVNLSAPVIIHPASRQGLQILTDVPSHSSRHPLKLPSDTR